MKYGNIKRKPKCKHPEGVTIYTNSRGVLIEACCVCDCKWLYGYGPGRPGHKTLGG